MRERTKQNRDLPLFPAARSVEANATDMLGAMPQMKNVTVYDIVVTDRYLKMPREISTSRTAATHVRMWSSMIESFQTIDPIICAQKTALSL